MKSAIMALVQGVKASEKRAEEERLRRMDADSLFREKFTIAFGPKKPGGKSAGKKAKPADATPPADGEKLPDNATVPQDAASETQEPQGEAAEVKTGKEKGGAAKGSKARSRASGKGGKSAGKKQ